MGVRKEVVFDKAGRIPEFGSLDVNTERSRLVIVALSFISLLYCNTIHKIDY